MTEHDIWSIPNVREVIDQAVAYVKTTYELSDADLNVRLGWSDDFDFVPSAVSGVGAQSAAQTYNNAWAVAALANNDFRITKIDKHYAVIFLGILQGNLGVTINFVEVQVGTKKVREYPGTIITSQLNNIFIAPDGIFAERTKPFRVRFNTSACPAASNAFPLIFVIERSGA